MQIGLLTSLLPWSWQAVTVYAFGVPLIFVLSWWILSHALSPLRRYPGPFFARWTNLWRLFVVQSGDYHRRIKKLHDEYGPVIRIGPNLIDLDYPELIKTLYSTDDRWRKTEFYHNNSIVVNGKIVYSIFSTTDPAEHARMQRPVAKYFSFGSVIAMEPLMDKALNDLCDQLERRFTNGRGNGQVCDLGDWIAFCAWDLITMITFSHPYGYMERGYDFDGTLSNLDKMIDYFSAVGQMPFLDFVLEKNPIVRIGPTNLASVTKVAVESLIARQQGKDKGFDSAVPDLLHHFIESKQAHPDLVDDNTIMGYLLIPLLAGADTTAITIRAVFYFLLRNPAAYRRLQEEILAAGFSANKPAPYNAARALPYLEAVIREAMRLHPAVCMPLERYVPAPGLNLPDGSCIPPGVAVGINPYIVGRNKKLWGSDADEFRPERWLQMADESETVYQDRLRAMKAADLAFGGGSRMCTGRHLALAETYKMVATLVRRFEIELVDPTQEWNVVGRWFFRQKGIKCHIKRRGEKTG
ncbi:Pisatin demethylase [Madurella fahalii]|uniref:Pisatin demethylase n=1 Tax=Madurella fahalii TaxID=1157608 RepID=A0ABQ0G4D3_9PEZI